MLLLLSDPATRSAGVQPVFIIQQQLSDYPAEYACIWLLIAVLWALKARMNPTCLQPL